MSRMKADMKRTVFFYADEDARYYDSAAELTQPHIDLIHDTMIQLVQYSLYSRRSPGKVVKPRVLVVASGTGAEALRLLRQIPEVELVAVDFSPAMNEQFRSKFATAYPTTTFSNRVVLVEEDFFGSECRPEKLNALVPSWQGPSGFDAVVGGLFLNHYPIGIQEMFYRRAFALLREGGVLVLAEGMHFESRSLSGYSHDYGERWIRRQLTDPEPHLRGNFARLGEAVGALREKWLHHWRTAHTYAADCVATTRLPKDGGGQTHTSMALAAGFTEVGIPFRHWEAAVLWAVKNAGDNDRK